MRSRKKAIRRPARRDAAPRHPPALLGHSSRWVSGFEHFSSTEGGHPFDAWLERDARGRATLSVRVRAGGGWKREGKTYAGGFAGAEKEARGMVRKLLASDPFARSDPKRRAGRRRGMRRDPSTVKEVSDKLYELAVKEHARAYAAAKKLPGEWDELDSPRAQAMAKADKVYNMQLEYQRKVFNGEVKHR